MMAEAALKQGDMSGAHGHIRTVVAHWPHSTAAWNVYARVAAAVPGGLRHNLKFLAPLRAKHPAALPLAILTGHSHTTTVLPLLSFSLYRVGGAIPNNNIWRWAGS